MKEQIIADGKVPHGFLDLCESVEDATGDGGSLLDNSTPLGDIETYFPLPTNEEQRGIVGNIKLHPEVLVQGPPGTGKSHTIANLICHLLATDKRVLVTAKTPRALQVLHEKLATGNQAVMHKSSWKRYGRARVT